MDADIQNLISKRNQFEYFFDFYFRYPGDKFVYEWNAFEISTELRIRPYNAPEALFIVTFDYTDFPETTQIRLWSWCKGQPKVRRFYFDYHQLDDLTILFSIFRSISLNEENFFIY